MAEASRLVGLAAPDRLTHLEPLELRVIEIERLVVAGLVMCGPERLRFCPRFKDGTVFPHRVGGIKRMIVSFRPLEKMKFDEAWYLVQMAVAGCPDLLESRLGPLCNAKAIHC